MNLFTFGYGKIKSLRNDMKGLKNEICRTNLEVLRLVCIFQMLFAFVLFLYSRVFSSELNVKFLIVQLISFGLPLIVLFLLNQFGKKSRFLVFFLMYFSIIYTHALAIYSDVWLKRDNYGVIYCIVLFFYLILFIDYAERIILPSLVSLCIFCALSLCLKKNEISYRDVFYSVLLFSSGSILNRYLVVMRVRELRLLKLIDGEQNKDPELDVLTYLTFKRLVRKNLIVGKTGCMLFLDLDDFLTLKEEETLESGDEILRDVVSCIHFGFRTPDFVCRYGNDQFLIYMPGANTHFTSSRRAFSFNEKLEKTFRSFSQFPVTVSIGISEPDRVGDTFEALFERSKAAMEEAKKRGKNCIVCTNCRGEELD